MTHTYHLSGMTCNNCAARVKSSLLMVPEVRSVTVSQEDQTATIEMEKHIPLAVLQKGMAAFNGKYTIEAINHNETKEQALNWFTTYKPILLIFAYLTGVTLLIEWAAGQFNYMRWMNHFMGGFFLVFSFFKLLNLNGFAESYAMYDIVAKTWAGWGYVYAFIEMTLGLLFLSGVLPLLTNLLTLIVMSVSLVGVLQSVLNKRKIQCACLGEVFKLPMSTVTVVEDALMIVMSGIMLVSMF